MEQQYQQVVYMQQPKQPKNPFGIIGFIFSLVAPAAVILGFIAVMFMAIATSNVNWQTQDVLMSLTRLLFLLTCVVSFALLVLAIIFSAVGIARAKKIGGSAGLSIAGLVISLVQIAFVVINFLIYLMFWVMVFLMFALAAIILIFANINTF